MSTTFKLPPFQGISEIQGVITFFQQLFGAWAGSELIKYNIFPIGSWNMQSDMTKNVPLTFNPKLNINRIIGIFLMINNDDGSKIYSANLVNNGIESAYLDSSNTFIPITRVSGGFFDSVNFSNGSVQRGELTVAYTT